MKIRNLIVLTALASLAACGSMAPATHDIAATIESASTASDHARIAEHFDRKATEYIAEAERHERMQKVYAGNPKAWPGTMPVHCRSLREKFLDAAREASALAEEHRKLGAAVR